MANSARGRRWRRLKIPLLGCALPVLVLAAGWTGFLLLTGDDYECVDRVDHARPDQLTGTYRSEQGWRLSLDGTDSTGALHFDARKWPDMTRETVGSDDYRTFSGSGDWQVDTTIGDDPSARVVLDFLKPSDVPKNLELSDLRVGDDDGERVLYHATDTEECADYTFRRVSGG